MYCFSYAPHANVQTKEKHFKEYSHTFLRNIFFGATLLEFRQIGFVAVAVVTGTVALNCCYLCCRLLGYTEDAIKSLTRAIDILRITHGTNSPFMKELMMKLDEAHAEASYNLSSKDE